MATKKIQTSNPNEKAINQQQGPRTGNTGTPSKRDEFKAMKNESSSEKSKLADFVMSALEGRGNATKSSINKGVEGLDSNRGPKSNPTADGARLPKSAKRPKTKG